MTFKKHLTIKARLYVMLQTVYAFHINAFQSLIYNVWFVYLYAKHVTALVAIYLK